MWQVRFLWEVDQEAEANEMSAAELSKVFGPALCRPLTGAYMSIQHIGGLTELQLAMQLLIENQEEIFRSIDQGKQQADTPEGKSGGGGKTLSEKRRQDADVLRQLLSATVSVLFEDPGTFGAAVTRLVRLLPPPASPHSPIPLSRRLVGRPCGPLLAPAVPPLPPPPWPLVAPRRPPASPRRARSAGTTGGSW